MAFADWSSLPAELIDHIADCFLATSDLDYYMDFRAVCRSWRSATEVPKNSPHPRFRPRQWVIIDRPFGSDTKYLLVNTATGRFVPKELPLLRDYWGSSTTPDGLLILFAEVLRRAAGPGVHELAGSGCRQLDLAGRWKPER